MGDSGHDDEGRTREQLLGEVAALQAENAALRRGAAAVDLQALDSLRLSERDLADFFENGPVGLHWVGPDGTILRANRAELELLGYRPEEYVGHHIAEFHADPQVIEDILARLANGETLNSYEARLRCKDGSIRHVLISSNVCWQNGQFHHTRCFTRDITERKGADEALRVASGRATDILESITDAFAALDADWRITYVNRETARLTGYTLEQIVGKTHWEVWPLTVGTTVEREYRRAVTERVAVHFEFYYEPLGLWLDIHAYPSVGGGLAIYFRDITESKRAGEALRRTEDRLALAVESAGLGTYNCELPFGKLVWNHWCKEHFFLPPDADVDIDLFFARLHPDDRDKTREALERSERERMPFDTEYRTVNPQDGSVKVIRAIGRYYYEDSGRAHRIDGVTLDVTQQRRLAEEREELLRREQKARAEAEAASKAKDHFLAVLSHELRTPLTPVLAVAESLAADPALPPQFAEDMEVVRRNVELEARLIDDIIDITRIARGTVRLHHEAVDAHASIRHVLQIYQRDIEAKRLEVLMVLRAKGPHVWADPARMQQILWNVINNAVKFTPAEGRITIRTADVEGGRLSIQITDTGVGITPDVLPRLFNAFEQGEKTVTRRFGGLGLGLTITKALVEMHGGGIEAASAGEGTGATFSLHLATVPDPAAARISTPQSGGSVGTGRAGLSILLVEDNEDTLNVMSRAIKMFGYSVQTATGVRAALELAGRERFDLLVSDIGLPDGSGWDIMRELGRKQSMRGIALSGYGLDEDVRKSREVGFAEHLTKPVNFQTLRDVIQKVAPKTTAPD